MMDRSYEISAPIPAPLAGYVWAIRSSGSTSDIPLGNTSNTGLYPFPVSLPHSW